MKRLILLTTTLILLSSCLKKPDYHIDISYSGEQLRYIQCPIGGSEASNFVLNGYGGIAFLEIPVNSPEEFLASKLPFFSLYTKSAEGDTLVRIMEREYLNEYPAPFGATSQHLGGLPRFEEAVFHNAYPFIRIDLIDEQVAMDVSMEAWHPYNPLNQENSDLPCAVIEWKLSNPGKTATKYSIAFSVMDLQTDSLLTGPGNISVSVPGKAVLSSYEYSIDCPNNVQLLWDDFSEDGQLKLKNDTLLFSNNSAETGAMYLSGVLNPGESVNIPFLFSWQDSIEQEAYIIENFDLLREKTLLYSEALITSSVPSAVLEAAISNVYPNRTAVKTFSPDDIFSNSNAVEEQLNNIMLIYQEWKNNGKKEWLGELWPDVKNALEKTWMGGWDINKEGVLRSMQPNDYGVKIFGPNMMTGSLYLAALQACSEMAIWMNEPQKSLEYRELFKKGLENYTELLWNDTYFIQKLEAVEGLEIPKYQFGEGCFSDQLYGQFLAFKSGMAYILDTNMVNTALMSIYVNNFKEEMRDIENVSQVYAANDESGLINCSRPDGNKPFLPFVSASEVWTGIEYQVAASLIYAGMREEGLSLIKAVRERYAGNNRNPFDGIKSGDYFDRSMAGWSVYNAMAGYHYDGTRGTMKFAPALDVLPNRFFWSTASAWGTIEASRAKIELICLHGKLEIEELEFAGKSFFVFREFDLSEQCEVIYEDEALKVLFPKHLHLAEGESFLMSLP